MSIVLAWLLSPQTGADIFVSPGGSDANQGSRTSPFATLERAREAVRELKQAGAIPSGGLIVWLLGGDYARTNSFELSAADSGTPEGPIAWCADPEERPRLLGGRIVTGFVPVKDAQVLGRLDAAARPHVYQVDLRASGFAHFGEMKSRGFGRPTTPAHCELFFAGRPMTLARWPNHGEWTTIAGVPEDSRQRDEHGGNLGELTGGFLYDGDRPQRWRDTTGLWVHGYWAYDWANTYEEVASLDLGQRLIHTKPPYGLYGFRKQQRFYFLNILEELDQPGEWFLDRTSGVLYFWPPGPIHSGEAILSTLEQPLLKLADASHIRVRGIVLEGTRGNAVEISGGAGNRIVGCRVQNIGNWGVTVTGGSDHGVVSCDVFDTGDGGVLLSGGDRQTLASGGHFTENCHFARQGRWSKCYVPAVSLAGVGLRASHNLIHDHPHCAILFWGNDHLIEFNDIHHIALETGDVGAIYTGRDFTFRGNRIRHNYIHETGGVGMGSMGVYMDDCVSGTEVFGNIFYQVHWAMFIGGGRDHRVVNNLFVACDPAIRADGRGLDPSPVWRNMVDRTMRERLSEVPLELYRTRYPGMRSLDAYYGPPEGPLRVDADFKGVPPEGNLVARNVCVGKWLDVGWRAELEMFDVRNNFITTDQEEVAGAEGGFRLAEDCGAWALGFQAIPFDRIGLRTDADRQRLQTMN